MLKLVVELSMPFRSHGGSYRFGGNAYARSRAWSTRDYQAYKRELVAGLRSQVRGAFAATDLLRVSISFVYPQTKRQKAALVRKRGTPDLDNLIKPVLDALEGIAYKDDKSIAELGSVRKVRELGAKKHRVEIFIEKVADIP